MIHILVKNERKALIDNFAHRMKLFARTKLIQVSLLSQNAQSKGGGKKNKIQLLLNFFEIKVAFQKNNKLFCL